MGTVIAAPTNQQSTTAPQTSLWRQHTALIALSAIAFVILGYHPYAEDGGIYMAAVKQRLHPELFPHSIGFVVAHTRLSLFVPTTVAAMRLSHLPLEYLLLLLQILSVFATVYALHRLAKVCFTHNTAIAAATSCTALALALPVAGTALYLLDPYVTARSFSTPLLLWTIALACERRLKPAVALWVLAAALHPLMALWGALPIFFYLLSSTGRRLWPYAFAIFVATGAVYFISPLASPAEHAVALSRSYWFFTRWEWYEWIGAIAPAIFAAFVLRSIRTRLKLSSPAANLLRTIFTSSGLVLAIALCFARPGLQHLFIARTQPLRTFHSLYFLFFILLAGVCGELLAKHRALRWCIASALIAAPLAYAQHSLYSSTQTMEWPWIQPANQWEQAFIWIRQHTPVDALVATDADYIAQDGEDADCFRAIAERSSLPDNAKDGGVASVQPQLSEFWVAGTEAQKDLSQISDKERISRLAPLGTNWVVLRAATKTSFQCPYRNEAVQVCRLPY